MASVSYFLRGKVADSETPIWLKFKDKDFDIRIPLSTLTCAPKDWKDGKCKSQKRKMLPSDEDSINLQLLKTSSKILDEYNKCKPVDDPKGWLKSILTPAAPTREYTDKVIPFIDNYISIKKNTVTGSTIKKANVVKRLLQRFVDEGNLGYTYDNLIFSKLNNQFRNDFEKYCEFRKYKVSTTYRNLKFIKMIAVVAASLDIEIHPHCQSWKFMLEQATKNNPKSVYLTFDELDVIENASLPHEHLENARDWLIIACFTGQRVSDYLRFTSDMIISGTDGEKYIQFIQAKTGAKMRLPLLKKVQEILDKRNGEFPRQISDVKLNLYIKEVCRIAGIDEVIYNGKMLTFQMEDGTKITRKVDGSYPKHELITSHCGRKSFATNFYAKIPTTSLLHFTGHTTEKQLLTYIQKSDVEKARSTAEIFKNLGY